MVKLGTATMVNDPDELRLALEQWLMDPELLADARSKNIAYMKSKTGATEAILAKLSLMDYYNGPAKS
jgi:hypothetical protein